MRKMKNAPLENSDTYSHKIIAAIQVERFGAFIDALSHLQTFKQKCVWGRDRHVCLFVMFPGEIMKTLSKLIGNVGTHHRLDNYSK